MKVSPLKKKITIINLQQISLVLVSIVYYFLSEVFRKEPLWSTVLRFYHIYKIFGHWEKSWAVNWSLPGGELNQVVGKDAGETP